MTVLYTEPLQAPVEDAAVLVSAGYSTGRGMGETPATLHQMVLDRLEFTVSLTKKNFMGMRF